MYNSLSTRSKDSTRILRSLFGTYFFIKFVKDKDSSMNYQNSFSTYLTYFVENKEGANIKDNFKAFLCRFQLLQTDQFVLFMNIFSHYLIYKFDKLFIFC